MTQRLDAIRDCLEGVVPAIMATCSADGTPNVAYLSQTEYVDGQHVALSYQFFNTTRRNILENPNARLIVTHPHTAERYRLQLCYLRTETAGPLFERMKAKLAGIASHTGMSGVFRLLGSDIYRVLDVERVPGVALAPSPPPRANLLAALRATAARVSACRDLDQLFTETLACLESQFDVHHAMLLLLDGSGTRLYTIASRGYAQSGVGSEIPLGQGVIGVAAREATPIRIGYMTFEYTYGRAIRAAAAANGLGDALETEIPLPGLAESASQLAVPIRAGGRLLGVLYVESAQNLRFGYDDEDALVALAGQLGATMLALQQAGEVGDDAPAPEPEAGPADGAPVVVRHYAADDSVFLDDDYLIKGVAGSIFWALVRDHVETGRNTFSNRALRLDPRIRLPDLSDNLEARLILLRRRLNERGACVRLEKAGRGRLQLSTTRPLSLVEVASDPART
ncbi:GAF domain-containing protein [Azoarcus sp. KH32C]|uniref:GAF domain-containing protein n=1 Tax=Azoarcus sp. KH32C TaxID=748247 RepID=UPI000238608B|nr:GAF domain-containing protein [Azoarcus sp. KH32C]BAL26737.1 putative phosphoenolpyruvate-protein phosphotransferase [Azoarcus sp. KH32C]